MDINTNYNTSFPPTINQQQIPSHVQTHSPQLVNHTPQSQPHLQQHQQQQHVVHQQHIPSTPPGGQQQTIQAHSKAVINQYPVDITPPRTQEICDDTIYEIAKKIQLQEVTLQQIDLFQRSFISSPSQQAFNQLANELANLKKSIDLQINMLEGLKMTKFLSPANILNMLALIDKLMIQKCQVILYDNELLASLEERPNNMVAVLVLEDQPFPNVYFKDKKGLDFGRRPLKIKLLRSSTLRISAISDLAVNCNFKNPQVKSTKPLDRDRVPMDVTKGGEFHCKFLTGSRKECANLSFECMIQLENRAQIRVPQVFSRPFVVITNESQWEDSMKKIFIQEVFQSNERLPWVLVANELTVYFLKATRQDLTKPTRGLSDLDFDYIHKKKFGGLPAVSLDLFEKFWDGWFGKVLRELRYKRHLRMMWNLGLIYGFVDKDYIKAFLEYQQTPGCFLLRFSETAPGSVAVNAIEPTKLTIKNYLIKAEETNPKKTHADFLRSKKELTHILQFMNSYQPNNGFPVFRVLDKDTALDQFYSRKDEDIGNKGYDDWENDDDMDNNDDSTVKTDDFINSFVLQSRNASPWSY
eukprot:TRINITY_DN7092_c0_g1_i2.p1 TRINITY_DN7092_c0_g1~~TRINITY_DN7092_c0_g1_i2.p1  ORF type:complete len:607 (-),score=164.02 TRINITY_DN7092_c0_g1_i2:346-2094(-)